MSFTYSVFGLTVRCSASVPGLIPLQAPAGPADIELNLGCSIDPFAESHSSHAESVVYTSAYTGPSGTPALRILRDSEQGLFHLVYFDGMQFWMDRDGTKLWASWPNHSSVEEAATYLLGPVLGLLLRFRGVTCLHASAVAYRRIGSRIRRGGRCWKIYNGRSFCQGRVCGGFRRCCGIGRAGRELLCFADVSASFPLARIGGTVVRIEGCSPSLRSELGKAPPFL